MFEKSTSGIAGVFNLLWISFTVDAKQVRALYTKLRDLEVAPVCWTLT